MSMGRKTISEASLNFNTSIHARNLPKAELGAIIFGCKHSTMKECLDKELFGLPAYHYAYVKKATPGLPLFLFNYSDRKLHGVFEAASCGQLNIYPYAWVTSEGGETTPFPAQVRIRTRSRCRPLLEEEIKPILAKNYYTDKFLWFELDKDQTERLMGLFLSSPLQENIPRPSNVAWKRPPISSNIKKTGDKEFKDAVWEESSGMAEARLQYEHSNISASSAKKWCDLFKPSSSSSVVNNGEVLEPQKVLNAWTELPPEANAELACVPECWEDIIDDGDSGTPNLPDMPFSENTTVVDGWGELNPSEFYYMQAEELGESLFDSEANKAPVENCERDCIQLNETDRVFQENRYVSEGVLMDAESSYFQNVLIKCMEDIEKLKVSQYNQRLIIEVLQQELVHSRQETNELKKRCQLLECLASSSRDQRYTEDCAAPNSK